MGIKTLIVGLLYILTALQVAGQEDWIKKYQTVVYKKDGNVDTTKTLQKIKVHIKDLLGDNLDIRDSLELHYIFSRIEYYKKTKYKVGFKYTNRTQPLEDITLLEWMPTGLDEYGIPMYRWRTANHIKPINKTYFAYTDDDWIDVATGKAFVNVCTSHIEHCPEKN